MPVTALDERGKARAKKPPPQCRRGAFENPQFKWAPETLERLASQSKESISVPYGFNVGSPKGSPRIEHGRGSPGETRHDSIYPRARPAIKRASGG